MTHAAPQRRRLLLRGQVQGVGMRPFLCRLAQELALAGWVGNAPEGVLIEAEGDAEALAQFERRVLCEAPPQARIDECSATSVPASGADNGFRVVGSLTSGAVAPCAPPDLAPCPECLAELFDCGDRRYRYPFLSCSHCGPRYSILQALPFDRERTAMRGFPLCAACAHEYGDPGDRRFHAQTLCCPDCGPRLALCNADGAPLAGGDAALRLAVQQLRQGWIVALKGVGGFQLLADAGNPSAVEQLRLRKRRPDKPFALLADLAMAEALCRVSAGEAALLQEAAAPIVLLQRREQGARLAPAVAPALPWLGIMLPASPLHHLLLADFGSPLVATSGNLGGEPICIDESSALARLAGIADAFLLHDRPVLRPLDDSIVRLAAGRPLTLRRARGYAPAPVALPEMAAPMLALGGHLKNTVALGLGRSAVLSQHLGDLDDALTEQQCRASLDELPRLFGVEPRRAVCDTHPDYASRRLAEGLGLPMASVPHHYAHALACMAEHGLKPPLLALAWDGIGLGGEGALWGGEFLRIAPDGFTRAASVWPLSLPGGEKAVKEPRRVALAALLAAARPVPSALQAAFSRQELATLSNMLAKGVNSPPCSSVGRLFDALAALLGLCQVNSFEGQAAMSLEAAAAAHAGIALELPAWPLLPDAAGLPRCDWRPWLAAVLDYLTVSPGGNGAAAAIAHAFHSALADAALVLAQREQLPTVVLCGGCFQNRLLLELCLSRLQPAGFDVYWPQRIPANDGGLALGQLLYSAIACPGL